MPSISEWPGQSRNLDPCPGRVPVDTKQYLCPKPCQAWAWSSNDSTCSLKENLVDVLELFLNTKTILELIFVACHTVFATPTTHFDLKFSIVVVAKGVWSKHPTHAPKMSWFSDSQTWQLCILLSNVTIDFMAHFCDQEDTCTLRINPCDQMVPSSGNSFFFSTWCVICMT